MDAQHCIKEDRTVELQPLQQQAQQLAACSRQAIESLKNALLLADWASIYGSNLANRINAGTVGSWSAPRPSLGQAPGFLAQARGELLRMKALLDQSGETV